MTHDYLLKKGEITLITSGEYSDYGVQTVVRALEDFHILEMRDEYLSGHREQSGRYDADHQQFVQWLVNERKCVEEVEHREWHIGSYSTLEGDLT
jgi:hypothetical protein